MGAILIIFIIVSITIGGFWLARVWKAKQNAETEDDKNFYTLLFATMILMVIGYLIIDFL